MLYNILPAGSCYESDGHPNPTVATSFGSANVELTFPLQSSQLSQMSSNDHHDGSISVWHKVVG